MGTVTLVVGIVLGWALLAVGVAHVMSRVLRSGTRSMSEPAADCAAARCDRGVA